MNKISLYNTLTRKKEEFKPIDPPNVGIYSCGPTVYWNQHIGHMYAYVQWDILVRFLKYLGYRVKWVMNITDVGHLTSDADEGEDKMEKGAKREGLTVWEIADKYIVQFRDSMKLLGIKKPDVLCRATGHITEQIGLIKKIEERGFTYITEKGLVFDTSKFPDYAKFAGLELEKQKVGARVDVAVDPEKKNPWDFFLWVFNETHIMQWDSPWGRGFPGWHIECTAMSTKYLGNNFDIHTGGMDHIPVHHTNEIAQGYGAFGKTTANYWLHNGMLGGSSGEKMSKSLGNFVTAQDLVNKGYDTAAMRYLILNSQYRKGLSFSFEALDSASSALKNLKNIMLDMKENRERTSLSDEKMGKIDVYNNEFSDALSDDLNVPEALAILWKMLKSNIPSGDKYDLAISFDVVFGLGLGGVTSNKLQVTGEIQRLLNKREKLRSGGRYKEADEIREEIENKGYTVNDTEKGSTVRISNKYQ